MGKETIEGFRLVGLKLPHTTTNKNGQSGIDCGKLWQQFSEGNYHQRIEGKLSDEIYAVYYDYEGDHTQPYSYFIGCKVNTDALAAEDMDTIFIPRATYTKIISKGKMPDCVAQSWIKIWSENRNRNYTYDYEVYDERSQNWEDVVVDIYLAIP